MKKSCISFSIIIAIAFAAILSIAPAAFAQNTKLEPNITSTFQLGHTGFWYDESSSGSGLSLTVNEGGVLAAALYTFSPTTYPVLFPGLQSGDWIEGANHVYMVGATLTSPGQYRVTVPLSMPVFGDGFMGPAEQTVEFGSLELTVYTCDRIDYKATINTGVPTGQPGVVNTVATGTLRKLVGGGGGTCALDCRSPDFGPLPAQCPLRTQ